jgi:hypothetical protein
LLWNNAVEDEETKNWADLKGNVDAIIMLQPHFLRVWQFQSWNLAYNVSAAWDLVPDRFYWVKEGAKFMKRGCVINDKVAQLPYEEGRILGTKIGRADEWRYFRKYFKVKDPNETLYKGRPDPELNPQGKDNYLAAKDVYFIANDLQQKYPQSISMLEVLFRGYPYRSQLSYADAMQREGSFDEVSRTAWEQGYDEWVNDYGHQQFPSPGGKYHLEMSTRDIEEEANAQQQDFVEYKNWVVRMQNETRYHYWKTRSQVESAQLMSKAHKLIYDGEHEFRKGNLSGAQDTLFAGMQKYQQIIDKFPDLATDDEAVEEGMGAVLYWQKILKLQSIPVPAQYPLQNLWTKHPQMLSTVETRFKYETGQD